MRQRLINSTAIIALLLITVGAILIQTRSNQYNDIYNPETMTYTPLGKVGERVECEPAEEEFNPAAFLSSSVAMEADVDIPGTTPKTPQLRLINVGIMLAIMVVATLLFHRLAHHRWLLVLMTFTIIYFGFIQHGCICPVGSVGHISNGLAHLGELRLSTEAILLFFIPLVIAILWGRIFCSSACPLGAIQTVLEKFSATVPKWLLKILGYGRIIVLIWVIVSALTTMGLPICKYDPFVKIFKLTGSTAGWIYTAGFILLAITVKRPFCRFLCPYAVLLGIFSAIGFKTRRIIADKCVKCKKCVKVCPVECISLPKISSFNCICCGECSKVCPTDAIK